MNNTYLSCLIRLGALSLLFTTAVFAQPCNTIATTIRAESTSLFAEAGGEDARLDLFYLSGPALENPISGELTTTDPTSGFLYQTTSTSSPECVAVSNSAPYPYDAYVITPDKSGSVRFRQEPSTASLENISMAIFRETFNADNNSCASFIQSTFTPSANFPGLSIDVEAGSIYVLVVMTGQDPTLEYPRPYEIIVDNGAGSSNGNATNFFTVEPLDPEYAYTYLAFDESNTVRAVSPQSDFRSLPVGRYTLRGVNYDAATLSEETFVGQGIAELQGEDPDNPNCLRLSEGDPIAVEFVEAEGPTPVDWLSFRAEATPPGITLIWEVASETENDYFRVERSPDGVRWTDIGEVAGNGTTQEYARFTFGDSLPIVGENYYRLQQVDFDGTEHLSTVVRISHAATSGLSTFPNPFTDQVTVRTTEAVPESEKPRLFNVEGREVTNLVEVQLTATEVRLDTKNLMPGIYLLRWAGQEARVVRQ